MLHAGGKRLGKSLLTFLETAAVGVLAVGGKPAEDAAEVSTNALGEELAQSDGHGESVSWCIGGRDVKMIVVVLKKSLEIVMRPWLYVGVDAQTAEVLPPC